MSGCAVAYEVLLYRDSTHVYLQSLFVIVESLDPVKDSLWQSIPMLYDATSLIVQNIYWLFLPLALDHTAIQTRKTLDVSPPRLSTRPLTTCCSRLGFANHVIHDVVEETMKAGVHGPAVTLYVVVSLLCLAEKRGTGNTDEVRHSCNVPKKSVS